MFKDFADFVEEMQADNSRLYKIDVLKKHIDDEEVKYYLSFVFDPYIVTGLSTKKILKDVYCEQYEFNFSDYDEHSIFEYIKKNNTGRDIDIARVQQYRKLYIDEALWSLYDAVVTKNLNIGVDVKTINKVFPGLIREFQVMLANKYFDKPEAINGKEFSITTKIDGSRIIAIKEEGEVKFYTRQGQEYIGLVDLEKELKEFPYDGIVLDGELVAANTAVEDTYKQTMKLSRTKDVEKHGLKMLVFDCLPAADFKAQYSEIPYTLRRSMLDAIYKTCKEENFVFFEVLPELYRGTDVSMVERILKQQVADGQEGIMLNITSAPYQFRRTSDLLKVKLMQDTEVVVTGFEEGTNKLKGTLGALICDYEGNTLKVGSGFSDAEREYIWNHQEEFLYKQITVQYFAESTNQNGGKSLRFPIFLRVREL